MGVLLVGVVVGWMVDVLLGRIAGLFVVVVVGRFVVVRVEVVVRGLLAFRVVAVVAGLAGLVADLAWVVVELDFVLPPQATTARASAATLGAVACRSPPETRQRHRDRITGIGLGSRRYLSGLLLRMTPDGECAARP